MLNVSTYLLFDGTCRQAMKFYQSCLGGELAVTEVAQSNMKSQMPAALHDKVLNARLTGGHLDISASDWMRADQRPEPGNTMCLYITEGSHEELANIFAKLSDGAAVTDPLKQMWFGSYGALNDRFGIRWMFHADAEPVPAPR